MPFFVPGGEALWLASNSCSVIGRVIGQGELVEVSVTGGQEEAAVAADVVTRFEALACDTDWKSFAVARQIAIACWPPPSDPPPIVVAAWGEGARPPPPEPPVSRTFCAPSDTRVKVNFG
jgi:hypothetical protein